jgi:ParB family transcriptional regulator, chromosome partitioning protein
VRYLPRMPPRKKKPDAASVGLDATEVAAQTPPADVQTLAKQIEGDGGSVLATYRDPFGAKWLLLASLPLAKVEPTPYQRELSETHADRLAAVIPKVGQFLDPVVAIRKDAAYWSPNGMHRLAALKRLGAKAVIALVVPDTDIAYRILALNTEKAHNLKDKSLEVVRMARGLAAAPDTAKMPESTWAFEFEEPAFLTIGACYEEKPRFSGGAYLPILKRCEEFSEDGIAKSLKVREARRDKVLELDEAVAEVVARLKAAGLQSAYLKPFVVARINPLRFQKAAKPGQKAPRAVFDATIDKMIESAKKFDAKKIRPQDLASMAGAPPSEE